jgi:hypothetical protein
MDQENDFNSRYQVGVQPTLGSVLVMTIVLKKINLNQYRSQNRNCLFMEKLLFERSALAENISFKNKGIPKII